MRGVAVAPVVGAWTPRAHGAREGRVRGFLGGALRCPADSEAPPQKKKRSRDGLAAVPLAMRRAHVVSALPQLVRPPHSGALAAGVPAGATHAVPGTPAACVEASSTRPTGV